MTQTSSILERLDRGETTAAEELLPLVYNELRVLAARKLACELPGQTLQPTALVHEAWLRLMGSSRQQWHSRGHFFAAAAEAIRRILIENARRKGRVRHGKGLTRVDIADLDLATITNDDILLEVDAALKKLESKDAENARLVNLRFFVGLSIPEVARELGISETTAKSRWRFCRAWLYQELKRSDPGTE